MVIAVCAKIMSGFTQLLYRIGEFLVPVKPARKKEGSFYIFIFKGIIDLFTSFREFITGKNQRDLFFV